MKKLLSTFAILLLLASPVAMAEETTNPNGWVEEVATDFGTDSYDEDGCFC